MTIPEQLLRALAFLAACGLFTLALLALVVLGIALLLEWEGEE